MAAGSRKHRDAAARLRAEHRPCWLHPHGLCKYQGQPIDYSAPRYHPMSFTADHRTPTNAGGLDVYENLEAAHWRCNSARHDDIVIEPHTERW